MQDYILLIQMALFFQIRRERRSPIMNLDFMRAEKKNGENRIGGQRLLRFDWTKMRTTIGCYLPLLRSSIHRLKIRSEEHTSELQSRGHLLCRLLLEKKKTGTH